MKGWWFSIAHIQLYFIVAQRVLMTTGHPASEKKSLKYLQILALTYSSVIWRWSVVRHIAGTTGCGDESLLYLWSQSFWKYGLLRSKTTGGLRCLGQQYRDCWAHWPRRWKRQWLPNPLNNLSIQEILQRWPYFLHLAPQKWSPDRWSTLTELCRRLLSYLKQSFNDSPITLIDLNGLRYSIRAVVSLTFIEKVSTLTSALCCPLSFCSIDVRYHEPIKGVQLYVLPIVPGRLSCRVYNVHVLI